MKRIVTNILVVLCFTFPGKQAFAGKDLLGVFEVIKREVSEAADSVGKTATEAAGAIGKTASDAVDGISSKFDSLVSFDVCTVAGTVPRAPMSKTLPPPTEVGAREELESVAPASPCVAEGGGSFAGPLYAPLATCTELAPQRRRCSIVEEIRFPRLEEVPFAHTLISENPDALDLYGLMEMHLFHFIQSSHMHTHERFALDPSTSVRAKAISACGRAAEMAVSFVPFAGKFLSVAMRLGTDKAAAHIIEKKDQFALAHFAKFNSYFWSRGEEEAFAHEVAMHAALMLSLDPQLRELESQTDRLSSPEQKEADTKEEVYLVRETIYDNIGQGLKSTLLRNPINSPFPLSVQLGHLAFKALKEKRMKQFDRVIKKSRSLTQERKEGIADYSRRFVGALWQFVETAEDVMGD